MEPDLRSLAPNSIFSIFGSSNSKLKGKEEDIDPPPKSGWKFSTQKKDTEKVVFGFSLFSIGGAGGVFIGTFISTIISVCLIYFVTFIIQKRRAAALKNAEESAPLKNYENL